MNLPKTNSWLPRFSLLTLVLATTIVALGITVYLQHRELAPLRMENQRLRAEIGELTVEDPSKLHVIAVEKPGGYRWEWRIHYPEGHDWWIHLAEHVPNNTLPAKSDAEAFLGARGGEVTLIAEVLRGEDGKRYLYLRSDTQNSPYLNIDQSDWVNGRTMLSVAITGEGLQVSSEVDEPLELLRLESDKRGKPEGYDEGLLIWISNKRSSPPKTQL